MTEKLCEKDSGQFWEVKSDQSHLVICKVLPDLLFCTKSMDVLVPSREIDVFGEFSCLMRPRRLPEGKIGVSNFQKNWEFNDQHWIFLPKFSLIHWSLVPGNYSWDAYVSKSLGGPRLSSSPIVFRAPQQEPRFTSVHNIYEFVTHQKEAVKIDIEAHTSAISAKVKGVIDGAFNTQFSICETLESLGLSHGVVNRSFKRDFGLAPVDYRKRMRVFSSAMELALKYCPIGEIANKYGYTDQSLFLRQFREVMNSAPSGYSIKKNANQIRINNGSLPNKVDERARGKY